MWEGYSLLHILGNGHSQGQDLGLPGSCLRKFSTMPYLFCNLNEVSIFHIYMYWRTMYYCFYFTGVRLRLSERLQLLAEHCGAHAHDDEPHVGAHH